jgi:hypothetical protein
MPQLRAQVVLHTKDALAANYVTNSWCILTAGVTSTSDIEEYTTPFKDFYDDLAGILGITIAQNGHEVKYYDLPGPGEPNYPVVIDTFNLTSDPSTASLPTEVACCLSFQGLKIPGEPQNRRRGRVYIGPLTNTVNSAGRPSTTLQTTLATAAVTLYSGLKACSVPGSLAIWSQVDQAAILVDNGWVDDAFDIQRRRGVERTSRTTWVAP